MSADGGFEFLDETLIYSGYVIDVFSTQWKAPDGQEFERDVVRHNGAVAVVPVVEGPEGPSALLVRQFRSAVGHHVLEIPAGLRDVEGESVETTARRELREEAGQIAGKLEHLVCLAVAVGFSNEKIDIFVATDLTETDTDADGVEELSMTMHTVPFSALAMMVASGELIDAKTIAGLMLARDRLGLR